MTDNYKNLNLSINEEKYRFELQVGDYTAFIAYKKTGNSLILIHTEVPEELEGKGVASAIVEKALTYAAENSLTVIPRCSYVTGFLKKHPEWNRVVEKN